MATVSTLPVADLGPQHLFLAVEVDVPDTHLPTAQEIVDGDAAQRAGEIVAGQLTGYSRRGVMTDLRLHMHGPQWIRVRTDGQIRLVDAPADQRPIVGFGS